jgi:hypothetical protein
MRCIQHFSQEVVKALQTEMWSPDHALRNYKSIELLTRLRGGELSHLRTLRFV